MAKEMYSTLQVHRSKQERRQFNIGKCGGWLWMPDNPSCHVVDNVHGASVRTDHLSVLINSYTAQASPHPVYFICLHDVACLFPWNVQSLAVKT